MGVEWQLEGMEVEWQDGQLEGMEVEMDVEG